MQLVDGMDNSSPLLNFVLGNLIGLSEMMFRVSNYYLSLRLYMELTHLMVFCSWQVKALSQVSYILCKVWSDKSTSCWSKWLSWLWNKSYLCFTPKLVAKGNYTHMSYRVACYELRWQNCYGKRSKSCKL
jgi:hypothetical protein